MEISNYIFTMSPKVTPGYHECPRCKSRNTYFAKRVVGQIGNLIDLPEGVSNPAAAMNIEKDVALCYDCRERMNWIPEKVEYSPEEQKSRGKKNKKYWGIFLMILNLPLLYFGYQLYIEFDESPLYLLLGIAGLIYAIGLLIASSKN